MVYKSDFVQELGTWKTKKDDLLLMEAVHGLFADPSSQGPLGTGKNRSRTVEGHVVIDMIGSLIPKKNGISLLGANLKIGLWEVCLSSFVNVR